MITDHFIAIMITVAEWAAYLIIAAVIALAWIGTPGLEGF